MTYDALVLAGGKGRRLGGIDKPALLVDGVTLLDRVLLACTGAATRVVVGPTRPTTVPVRWMQEEVRFGGPVAGLAAGLTAVTADVVVLLAADLPYLDEPTVAGLAATPGALLLADDREQWLCSAWMTQDLRAALAGREVVGTPLSEVLGPLTKLRLDGGTGARSPWTDIDTPTDLAKARGWAAHSVA